MKLSLLPIVAGASVAVYACAPYTQPSYLNDAVPYTAELSQTNALKRLVAIIKDLLPPPDKIPEGLSTIKAEYADFSAAVEKYFSKSDREKISVLKNNFEILLNEYRGLGEIKQQQLPELPEELKEFQLFLEGRKYLMVNNPDHIPPAWKKLLELPPEKRHYRTVWVYFMLGNHFKKDLHKYYDDCRKAAREGFADTAGLARRSYVLEIRYGKNMARIIRRAAEAENALLQASEKADFLASINWNEIRKLDDGGYFALISDPVCREYLSVIDNSPRFRRMIKNFKLRNADICAFYAYQDGDIAEAKEFIAIQEKPTLLSLYLEAKIARHDGNTAKAVSKLRQWIKMAEKINPEKRDNVVYVSESDAIHRLDKDVYGILGLTMVMRRDFTEAARFFHNAEQYDDLYEVAERFMTLDQLTDFLKTIPKNPELENLTARRAFRERNFKIAGEYFTEEYRQKLKSYLDFIEKSNDTKLDDNDRAIALYNAAKIMRYSGMELCGTQGAPDFYPGLFGNNIPKCQECKYDAVMGYWNLCNEHAAMNKKVPGFNAVKDHRNIPLHLRYHYRYIAGELALKAGDLARDQELRALIFYFGGNIFKKRSNMEADVFYKRLVLNCRKTMLGKLADRVRWFPVLPVIDDEVSSEKPCKSLEEVRILMQKAFPSGE